MIGTPTEKETGDGKTELHLNTQSGRPVSLTTHTIEKTAVLSAINTPTQDSIGMTLIAQNSSHLSATTCQLKKSCLQSLHSSSRKPPKTKMFEALTGKQKSGVKIMEDSSLRFTARKSKKRSSV